MDTDWEDIIIQYHRNQLSEAKRLELEQIRANDPIFDQEVTEYGMALEAIRLQSNTRLRERLNSRGKELDIHRPPKKTWRIWTVLLAILMVAILIISRWVKEPIPAAPVVPNEKPASDSATMPAPPPPPISPPVRNLEKTAAPESRQIFADFFQPYRDDSLEPTIRGASDPTPEEQFLQYYWSRSYREAAEAFDGLEPVSKSNDNIRFLYANCLLHLNRSREATAMLTAVVYRNSTRFRVHTHWYLGLSLLAEGRREEAALTFNSIANTPDSPRRDDARRVLRLLQ